MRTQPVGPRDKLRCMTVWILAILALFALTLIPTYAFAATDGPHATPLNLNGKNTAEAMNRVIAAQATPPPQPSKHWFVRHLNIVLPIIVGGVGATIGAFSNVCSDDDKMSEPSSSASAGSRTCGAVVGGLVGLGVLYGGGFLAP